MIYLLSGVTSFTGIHLLERLINANNDVICITSRNIKDVESKKYKKIMSIRDSAKTKVDFIKVDYTEDINIRMIDSQIDGFISHGYFVNDYKNLSVSPYDIAIKSTIWMKELKKQLDERGCKSIAVTGTYFSNFKDTLQTPYSVSKTIAWEYIKFIFKQYNMLYYLFPNPYGIYESQKLSYQFIKSLINNEDFNLGDPHSIRDNIPVEFLVDDYYNNIVKITGEQKKIDNNVEISSPSYIQQSNIEYLKFIMNGFLKVKSSKTKIILPNITPKPSIVTGRKSIRDRYITQEEGILENYINSYTTD